MTRASSARNAKRSALRDVNLVWDAIKRAGRDPSEFDPETMCRIIRDWRANGLAMSRKSLSRMIGEIVG